MRETKIHYRIIVLHNTAAAMVMSHNRLGKGHAMRIAAEANLDNRISGLQVRVPIGEAACVAARGRKKPERSTQHTDLVKRSKAL